MLVPRVSMVEASEDTEPGYAVGIALDELVAWARGEGAMEDELRERLEESLERAGE